MYFRFLALDSSNEVVRGVIYADSQAEAEYDIRSKGLDLKLLQEVSENRYSKPKWWSKIFHFSKKERFSNKSKQQFFQQMYILLKSGISIEKSLQIINDEGSDSRHKSSVCTKLLDNIRAGKSLSDAMNVLRSDFTFTEINVMRAAEQVGCPEEAMKQLSEVSQNIEVIKSKFVLSMIYPCIVLVVTIFVMLLLSKVVVPQFQELFFAQRGLELPFLTRKVVGFCEFFNRNFGVIAVSVVFFIFIIRFFHDSQLILKLKEWLCRRLPVVNKIVRDYNIYLFSATLGMLLSYGIILQQGISIAKNVVTNPKIKAAIEDAVKKIHYGDSISYALSKIFSRVAIGIIVAGEHIGKLNESFIEIAETYRKSLLSKLMLLSTLIEPFLIIFVATLVGVTVVAIFLPLVDLIQGVEV